MSLITAENLNFYNKGLRGKSVLVIDFTDASEGDAYRIVSGTEVITGLVPSSLEVAETVKQLNATYQILLTHDEVTYYTYIDVGQFYGLYEVTLCASTLYSLSIATQPSKTTYSVGDTFETAGLVVAAEYVNSTVLDVTEDCSFSPSLDQRLTTSDTSVTVSYTESGITKTVDIPITVNESIAAGHATCNTAGATAAKVAKAIGYSLRTGNVFTLYLSESNTAESALTLNVSSTGAKAIYINGEVSSSTNYSLPAGTYEVYYDGTSYYIRTDGKMSSEGLVNVATNNEMTYARRITRTVSARSTGVGTWDDSRTPDETDWWQDDRFKFPASINSKDLDFSFKYDPEYGGGEVVILAGYILDTTTGKLCLQFANQVKNAHLIAVDITYTPSFS